MQKSLKLTVASDHAGVELKDRLSSYLKSMGHTVLDYGIQCGEKADYPDMAVLAVGAVVNGDADYGILICGTGIGMSIAANRFMRVRAALCHDEFTTRLARKHNNANILCLGARVTTYEVAESIVNVWLNTDFEGGRHSDRIHKIDSNAKEIGNVEQRPADGYFKINK